jgi:hypothetical protein
MELINLGWTHIAPIVATLFIGAISGGLGAYVALRGKNLATRHDIELIRRNTEDTHEIVKKVDNRFSVELEEWRHELVYRQEQLSQFYGPVYAILGSQMQTFDLWIKGKMGEKNREVKEYFAAQNERICELITSHAHLIEGRVFPQSFTNFFTNALIFKLYAASSENGEVPEHLTRRALNMPFGEFSSDIISVTHALKVRLENLHLKHAEPLSVKSSFGENEPVGQKEGARA